MSYLDALFASQFGPASEGPFLTRPANPNSVDDEFRSGSPDLAARGWYVYDILAGQVMNRVDDVMPGDDGSGLALNEYRSTLMSEGGLLVQTPQARTTMLCTKAHALTENACLYMMAGVMGQQNPTSEGLVVRAHLGDSQTSESNNVIAQRRRSNVVVERLDGGVHIAGVFNAASNSGQPAPSGLTTEVFGLSLFRENGTTRKHYTFMSSSLAGGGFSLNSNTGDHLSAYPYAGFLLDSYYELNGRGLNLYSIRFIRAKSGEASAPFFHSVT